MSLPALRPTRRLRQKTCVRQPLAEPLQLGDEAPPDAKRQVYLVTFPHPRQTHSSTGEVLVAPSSMAKEELLQKLLHAFENPMYANHWQAHGSILVDKTGVWFEHHQADANGQRFQHGHSPVLGVNTFRYLPVKRALLQRHGLASHWSVTHTGYWSTVRYLAMASPTKPLESLDHHPVLWARCGQHPPVQDCCYEPVTARALNAKRQKLVQAAAQAGEAEPKINDLDVWALVVRAGVRNTADDRRAHLQLASFAKQHCGEAMVHYLFRRRHQLPGLIDDIWQWENVEQLAHEAQLTRLQSLQAAAQGPCVCGKAWLNFVVSSFLQNGINIAELCHDVLDALTRGRSETTPVIVLAGRLGGEGKSVFLKALRSIFAGDGFVFGITKDSGNFPFLDLPLAKVAFLDEYRFDPDVVSWATQCLWFDGSAVPLGRPQNVPGVTGNIQYKGSAPVFITTKLADLQWLESYAQVDPATGVPWNADASMICRRLKVHRFPHRVQKPSSNFPFCRHCFANLLMSQAAVWQSLMAAARAS